ncbi:MAG: ABC transporter permease [Candidatus Nanopelagicus sp.]|nr:ABC transporter permease [Candidatus Nanopelagicus sp.]
MPNFPKLAQVRKSWDTAILVLLLTVLILASLTTEGFLTALNFSYIFSNTSEITIIAFAMLFMIIMGEIDLSVASILALGSAMLGWSYAKGAPIWLSIIICILVGTLCGLVNGFLVTKLGLGSLAVTIGTLALYRGIANGILGENTVNEFPEFWTSFGFDTFGTSFMPKTLPLIIFFGIMFGILLHRTPFGRRTLAIGQSPEAARFAGVNIIRHKMIVFTFTGFMSGIAGVVYTFRFSTAQADNGVGIELLVISAILLGGVSIFGGIGTMWGVVAGVLLAGSVESWLTLREINAQWRTIVTGLLLLLSVAAPVLVQKSRNRRERKALKS